MHEHIADPLDRPRDLVPEYERQPRPLESSFDHVQIRVAHAGSEHPHDDPAGTGNGLGPVLDDQRGAERAKDRGIHAAIIWA